MNKAVIWLVILITILFPACREPATPEEINSNVIIGEITAVNTIEPPAATTAPIRTLSICLGGEPQSLFIYADVSKTAQIVREAIYDGPIDTKQFQPSAVILESIPTLENGGITIEPIRVKPGNLVVDVSGNLSPLQEGTIFMPAGCRSFACAERYEGQEPVLMDHVVVRYKLRQGILWSDGEPLTAKDSQFSFDLAASQFPKIQNNLIARTLNYYAQNPSTIIWETAAGYLPEDYISGFYTPLPEHAWGNMTFDELIESEIVNRNPMGWGAYTIEDWIPGEQITLKKSDTYFRKEEGLPKFERLVFKFTDDKETAFNSLASGDCDYIGEEVLVNVKAQELVSFAESNGFRLDTIQGKAWEFLSFGINSLDMSIPPIFASKETRQALALCVDRERLVNELFAGRSMIADSYVHPNHPLYDTSIRRYSFDPQQANALLDSIGWIDQDGDSSTPRIAQNLPGIQDGTPLEFMLITTDEEEKVRVGEIIRESLRTCGINIEIQNLPVESFYASGLDSPVFGRRFSLSQFNWQTSLHPPCRLYHSEEIPGPYPEYPMGWGGANVSGYSNPDFDNWCSLAGLTIPEMGEHIEAQLTAQAIYGEEIPSFPLYLRPDWLMMRPDMCGVQTDPSAGNSLSDIELYNYGEGCR